MSDTTRAPGPKGLPVVGCMLNFRRDALNFLLATARDYGDVARIRGLFGHPIYLLSNPEHVRYVLAENNKNFVKSSDYEALKLLLGEGLLTSEGIVHKRQRRLIQPAFHKKQVAAYAQIMTEYCARMCERWSDGATLDVHKEMTQVALWIVGKALFNAEVEAQARQVGEAVATLMPLFDNPILIFMPRLFEWLPQNRRFLKEREILDATVYRMIEEHRKSGDSGDLMSMLLAARDEEDDNRHMTDQQVRDEVMTLFLAGHETTANAMTWTWYLLAQNPAAESRLHAELDKVLAGRTPTVDDLPNLQYTRMVLAESMRLYPPAWVIGRRALNDFQLAGCTVPAGSDIAMSPYVIQHDPRFFPDPFRFDPERWTPEAEAARPEFSYFPFGGGPRLCVGESFAKMEAALLIAMIAQRWRMRLAPGYRVESLPLVTLRPRYGLQVTLERREKAAPAQAA
jgi:cytochrome P450